MKISAPTGSLKAGNLKWLSSLVAVDVLFLLVFVFPELIDLAPLTKQAVARGMLTSALPVIVLVLVGLLSPNVKASLVYWKGKRALPGHESFSRHAPADVRIDMSALKKNVGTFPSEPAEQNAFWYKLYKKVDAEVTVKEAHRAYLLFRDMASMSVLLLVIAPPGLYFNGVPTAAIWSAVGLFAVQYLITAIAAKNSGIRFVTNVLAIHAAKKVIAPKGAV
jgi:hypothetical protein